jgi:hypothetical protein
MTTHGSKKFHVPFKFICLSLVYFLVIFNIEIEFNFFEKLFLLENYKKFYHITVKFIFQF